MARVRLSKRYCDSVVYSGTKLGSLDVRWDESLRGFGLRVYPSGRKSWVIYYRTEKGKQRWYKIGAYEHLPIEHARAEARVLLGRVARDSADPAGERKAAKQGDTVADLARLYIEEWAKPRKKSWTEDQRQINADVLPAWGSRRMADVKRADVRALLESVVSRGSPVAANRLLAVLRVMFGFAVDRELLEFSPCERVKPPTKETSRERVLNVDEICALWHGASGQACQALRFMLSTAQRPGECVAAHWSEIAGEWWTIPQERAKSGRSHRAPLNALALETIGRRRAGFVFPSRIKAKHLSKYTLDHAVAKLLPVLGLVRFTPHDLRRTAASHMAGLGVPRIVISRLLGHAEGGVTSIYDRHSYDNEKKSAMAAWSQRLSEIVSK